MFLGKIINMEGNKVIIAVIALTILILGGAVFFLGKSPSKATLEKTIGAKVETSETSFDFKDIPYSGGDAIHEFKIKNIGDKNLEIGNLATSCACSKTYFKGPKGEGPKFGMKGMTPVSDWKGALLPGEEGVIVTDFNPTYHGPQGVGPISRLVSFETNDPDHPSVEFAFSGNVIK